MAAQLKVDVNSMPRIVFTGDSQTCGCVGAMDYAQMMSWEVPLRVFNRAVGGSNTSHLLGEFGGGTVTVKAGERVVHGDGVGWYAGPYIGQTVRIGAQQYTVDSIKTLDYAKRICELHLTEPAREDYTGKDYMFEAGWRIRVADVKPQYACFMYTVNDAGRKPEDFKAKLAEIVKRCREAGIQPLFISGVPMMDAVSGGSHPGAVSFTAQRAQDLLEFCQAEKLPYGDVYRMLDWLDPQRTSVWADTIHPTNDGSILAIHALRHLLKEMGATGNPYYVRGYRAPGAELPVPGAAGLQPIATAQPRRDKSNRENQAGHNLEAQRLRDHYGLIAEADGQMLTSATAVLFKIGVGPAEKLEGFDVEVGCGKPGAVQLFDWKKNAWVSALDNDTRTRDCVQGGAVWVGVPGAEVSVNYVAMTLRGDVPPWQPPTVDRAIIWPTPGEFDWSNEGNLLANGDFTQKAGAAPTGWTPQGPDALYLPEGIVTSGTGEFGGTHGYQFKCAGGNFTAAVRPLDMLVIKAEMEGGGNFLVRSVVDGETLALRRTPKTAPGTVDFEVRRWSGLRAVPGGCCLEAKAGSEWRTEVALTKGTYRLQFFYRAFNPAAMNATAVPAARPLVTLDAPTLRDPVVVGPGLDCAFLWLRGGQEFALPEDGKVTVRVTAEGPEAVQFTGVSVQKL
ncbi:MAG: SGNH/GDSL hydrolase family protein [Armatimonadetes bacterium]|nr:SGNH/GDSL hydrolase family protein [Armatimonadota bacterium]